MRGYFGIGIENTKTAVNVGTLWRSAYLMGAAFMFTIGRRYKRQSSDTVGAVRHIPLFHYETFADFYEHGLPYDCRLVGVELVPGAIPLPVYPHPDRCVYLLGAEDGGLSRAAQQACHETLIIPTATSLNVAVAGSLVLYDRLAKAS
jgi:tRNA (guanosine-2'-O-)-methyltransferase